MSTKYVQYGSALALMGAFFLSGCVPAHPVVTIANPYDSVQQFMEGIYGADQSVDAPSPFYRIRATVVPHHLTASTSMAAGIKILAKQRFKRIVLLSPDHFHQCPTELCTVNGIFRTQFGDVHTDVSVVDHLTQSSLVTETGDLFQKEHGIHAVLPFIAYYEPNVSVTPVVLSQVHNWKQSKEAIRDAIASVLDDDTVLVVSSDFSHYLGLSYADRMDDETAKAIFAKDFKGIESLDNADQSDCPGCLWILASIADQQDFYNPSVLFHTNSARLLKDASVRETTSHFSMAWYQNFSLTPDDLAVAGDVTMTRVKRTPKLKPAMQQFWSGSGVRLVNLEGPVEQYCAPDRTMFDFCNGLSLWKGMLGLATHWGLMNNHMLDQGVAGFVETNHLIEQHHETPVLDTIVSTGSYRFITLTALLNPVADSLTFSRKKQYDSVIAQLRDKKPGVLTVVLVHEGKEYAPIRSDSDNAYLQSFIDAGADVVVSAHTHVISDMTIYNNKPIFRGVGNFIFDQWDDVATSTAKAVRLRLSEDGVAFESFIGPG